MSLRARLLRLHARLVEKPTLALVTSHWLARRIFVVNARLAYSLPRGLTVERTDLGGVPAWSCCAGEHDRHGTLLYLHGGAFVLGDVAGYRGLVARLARRAGQRGIYLDYRLAPEHPFPAALDDAEAAYRALLEADRGPVTLAGDSAGGNLCLALLHRLLAKGLPLPAACAVFSPVTDLRLQNPSLTANAGRDPLVPPSWGLRGTQAYLAGHDPADPEVSPVLGTFTGAPPVWITVDRDEVLYDDSVLMAEKLRSDGVDVTLTEHDGLFHVWPLHHGRMPEADATLAEAGAFLRARAAPPPG